MLDQVKQMEKYKAENSSELTELKIQIKQLNQQISDMQNGKGPASNRSLDNRVGQPVYENQQQNPAYQLNRNAEGNRNQEIPVAGGIAPQRTQLVRTITSNSITTANNGVLEVTPIVEKNITNANQKRVVKAGLELLSQEMVLSRLIAMLATQSVLKTSICLLRLNCMQFW